MWDYYFFPGWGEERSLENRTKEQRKFIMGFIYYDNCLNKKNNKKKRV